MAKVRSLVSLGARPVPGSGPSAPSDDPHRLAAAYLQERERLARGAWSLKFWRDEWWRWDGRRYHRLAESELRADVTNGVKSCLDREASRAGRPRRIKITRSLVANVLNALQGLVLIDSGVEQPAWVGASAGRAPVIALSNGLVDVDRAVAGADDVLRPHSADWFSPVSLDYAYDPAAGCPRFEAFLSEVLEGDPERMALAQEWFGYSLTPDTSMQKFLLITGEGGTGKTVFTNTLMHLLGPDNVSHVPLELMGHPFQLTTTLCKLANIATEVSEIDRAAEGVLKAFTSGDRMHFDRKHLQPINARPTARLVLTTNTLPRFRDRSTGLWRRLILLPFNVAIPPQRQDRRLPEELKSERSGILNLALRGLRRLRTVGRFTDPVVCREALDAYRLEANPAQAFLEDGLVAAPGSVVTCDAVFTRYRGWCAAHGYDSLTDGQLGKEIARRFPVVTRRRGTAGKHTRPWMYHGVRLI